MLRGAADGATATDDQYVAIQQFAEPGDDLADLWSVRAADSDCDGHPDVALGLETADESFARVEAEGAVAVLRGGADGLVISEAQVFAQGSGVGEHPQAGDRFGRGLGWGDFDADGCADLLVGAAFESADFGQELHHGLVHLLSGSPSGLVGTDYWDPDAFGMSGSFWDIGLRLGYDLT